MRHRGDVSYNRVQEALPGGVHVAHRKIAIMLPLRPSRFALGPAELDTIPVCYETQPLRTLPVPDLVALIAVCAGGLAPPQSA